MNTPKACYVMSKPTSSVCNLDCTYCYYLEKEKLYPEQKNYLMDDETLEVYIKQFIDAQAINEVTFAWQGGEPTMAGIDFYKKALAFQKQYSQGKTIHNSLQTNGILINDAWCTFFKENDFLIGLSIDGPQDLHDTYRLTRSGKPTFEKVVKAAELLKKHKVEFNTLTVVNAENVKQPERVYNFLKSIGSTYIQFIPLVERASQSADQDGLYLVDPSYTQKAQVTDWSVPSAAYGDFLNRIFDIWVRQDVGRTFVQMFDTTLAAWCGQPAHLCIFSETCGHAFALESNGDLYQCDHYVYSDYRLGNVHDTSIKEMNQSQDAIDFGLSKKSELPPVCQKCDYQFACHGGCPKHRFIPLTNSNKRHNYFCEGYKSFFKHSESYMKTMVSLLQQHRSPMEIMDQLNVSNTKTTSSHSVVGRNDPCPCNSGKKYKKCCAN